jgi:hypothetical protein
MFDVGDVVWIGEANVVKSHLMNLYIANKVKDKFGIVVGFNGSFNKNNADVYVKVKINYNAKRDSWNFIGIEDNTSIVFLFDHDCDCLSLVKKNG